MKLTPYPEYKDSGVPWLGEIPVHWEAQPNRSIFTEIKKQGYISEPLLSVTIKRGIILQSELLSHTSKKDTSNLDKSKYKLVCPNDIAYNKMRGWQGAFGLSKYRGIVSPAYVVLRVKYNHDPNFFHYLLRTSLFAKEAERHSYGITPDMWSLRPEHFRLIYIPIPAIHEQSQIARFLDWKISRINKFTRNKKRLIELLKEQKQVIVNRAVTKGLNPDAKLKPSGIDWLGEIPEHWDVIKFKYCASFLSGGTPSKSNVAFWKGQIPWVSPKDMKTDYIFDTKDHVSEEAVLKSSTNIVEKGSLLIVVRSGILKRMIPIAINKVPVAFNQDIKAVRVDQSIFETEYLRLIIEGCQQQLLEKWRKTGATVESIEHYYLANNYWPHPPLFEQKELIKKIKDSTTTLNQTIVRAEREIALITEYKERLISDVVTGKVDVREVKVPEISDDDLLPPYDEEVENDRLPSYDEDEEQDF